MDFVHTYEATLSLTASALGSLNGQQDWLVQGGGDAVWPTASLLWVCRCSRCFSAPAALAKRRRRTETRPTSFILHPMMEVTQESTLAQNKSPGVTDGDAKQEGNQLGLKVFHLFFISGRWLWTHFWWHHLPGTFGFGYVRCFDSVLL